MFLEVRVEEQKFKLSIGKAYNDWTWLAHYASRVYSKTIYPQGVYIPSLLYLETKSSEFHPHPREKIYHYLQHCQLQAEDVVAVVKIRKANHIFSDFERRWESQAFGEERYLSEIKFSYKVSNVNRKKDFYFKVVVSLSISEDIRPLINASAFKNNYELRLQERQITVNDSIFEASIKLPYGSYTHRLFYLQRESANEDYQEHELRDHKIKAEDFKVSVQPKYISAETVNTWVEEDMKITDSISKSLQEKELEAKKRNTNSSLCCFTFEQIWTILENQHGKELSLAEYQESTKQRIRIALQKHLNDLYEIFFYYFIVDSQQRDKKEDLSITYQHLLHFLRDYQVLPQMKDLLAFIEFYNADYKIKCFEDTLNLETHGIRFPQFVAVLLRAIQFLQTSTFMMKGETFDSAVTKVLQKVAEIEKEEDEFSDYRRNIRENPKIISFVRGSSQQLKKIFSVQALNSVQNSAADYCLRKEEIKRMLQAAAITDRNLNVIVEECFGQLRLREEGIFYYEFLLVWQWLGTVVVAGGQEAEQIADEEEEALLIVEKMKFLVEKIVTTL